MKYVSLILFGVWVLAEMLSAQESGEAWFEHIPGGPTGHIIATGETLHAPA